jgi:AcrR family transcriptional regulator
LGIIARKAGVSQATIYNNIGSKEALAREFVTAAVEVCIPSRDLCWLRASDVLTDDNDIPEKCP